MIRIFFTLICVLLSVSACSSASSSFEKKAVQKGLELIYIQGDNFEHAIFRKNISANERVLHVYLGSDGTPWFQGRYATRDPTPLRPVMLDLMKMDQSPAIYLGRPCYHQKKMPQNCNKLLWTHQRYSVAVVQSMVAALRSYMQQYGYQSVRLFGFSGGGALAMLIAARLDSVGAVITLAGNLDIDAWTTHHNYLPLAGSLNPAKEPPLPIDIKQIHIAGGQDNSVPGFMIKKIADRQRNAQYILLDHADHHCCWKEVWPSLLEKVPLI